ncbi:hypothetical protein ACHAXA_005107 [Cyclostephanos tholiformis]|uniref:Uncharacterized protein n=1 Tax=Cyclostephanos tholiformis TaxID=382380 RepID=A0ABD3RX82_9STRA
MAESRNEYQHGIPSKGMCCLCTMEDITEEDLNYVEFQSYPSMKWKPAQFELCVVQQLLDTQFEQYINRVKTTDCQAELRRLLKGGPPIYVSDKHAFPLEENDTHVCRLWFAVDGQERSAKLKGAVEGAERDALWRDLNEFIIEVGKEEGDDVEETGGTSTD